MTACVRCLVSGRVQGVWYRASTQKQAQALGLDGYAKNLASGQVEVVCCGEAKAVTKLQEWLWQGPPHAKVSSVQCQPWGHPCDPGFYTA